MVLRHFEGAAFRRARAALDIVEGLLVGRDQAGAGAALDRHVADRHAPFHGERFDRLAGIFDDVAGAAGGADLADDGEDDVLGGDAFGQLAVDAHQHVLRLGLDQRLGGQHMLDLGCADAVRQRAEGAMRRGMAVAADDGRAGQREALLGPDDMHDALAACRARGNIRCRNRGRSGQRFDLQRRLGIVDALGAVGGRHVVVDHGQRLLRRAHLAAGHAQALEGLRAGHLVHEMAIDIEQAGAVRRLVHQMGVPDLVVEGAGLGHGVSSDQDCKASDSDWSADCQLRHARAWPGHPRLNAEGKRKRGWPGQARP